MTRRALLLCLAVFLAGILVGECAAQELPRIIVVTRPYAAMLPLDTADHALGRTGCDLGNQPVIYINPRIRAEYVPWVLTHEKIHAYQSWNYPGGCFAFAKRYAEDDAFRLQSEADAFCGVWQAQTESGMEPLPNLATIVALLLSPKQEGYSGHWTEADVKKALACWTDSKPPRPRE